MFQYTLNEVCSNANVQGRTPSIGHDVNMPSICHVRKLDQDRKNNLSQHQHGQENLTLLRRCIEKQSRFSLNHGTIGGRTLSDYFLCLETNSRSWRRGSENREQRILLKLDGSLPP